MQLRIEKPNPFSVEFLSAHFNLNPENVKKAEFDKIGIMYEIQFKDLQAAKNFYQFLADAGLKSTQIFEFCCTVQLNKYSENRILEAAKIQLPKESTVTPMPAADYNRATQVAFAQGHTDLLKFLLTKRNNQEFRLAAKRGNVEVVKHLLIHAQVDATEKNNSAIRWASYHGHLNVVKLLLTLCKNINAAAKDNFAVHWASFHGHLEILRCLLERPEVSIPISSLHVAAINGDVKILSLLLAHPKCNLSDNQLKLYASDNRLQLKNGRQYANDEEYSLEIKNCFRRQLIKPVTDKFWFFYTKNAFLPREINDEIGVTLTKLCHLDLRPGS